jgi:hypothetical protein
MWKLVADQLDNADLLAKQRTQAALRRAVSTAYYALFQALAERSADALVGWTKPWEVFTPMFRSLDHARTLTVLTSRGGDRKHPLGETVEKIGFAFKELHTAREWADYNPEPHPLPERTREGARFSRQDALDLIAMAREAVRALDNLDKSTQLKLATRLVTRPRKETNR